MKGDFRDEARRFEDTDKAALTKAQKAMTKPALQVWHIPNPPREPYCVPVTCEAEAIRVLRIIADYDLYLGDLIFANAQGLEQFVSQDDGWQEWEDENYDDIRALADALDNVEDKP